MNFVNEHGNTPLHYACFWNYELIAEDLIDWGSLVSVANKYGETPLNKANGHMAKRLHGEDSEKVGFLVSSFTQFHSERAVQLGQDLRKREFKDQSWLGLKTRSRDPTLSRHKGININELYLQNKIATSATGKTKRSFGGSSCVCVCYVLLRRDLEGQVAG